MKRDQDQDFKRTSKLAQPIKVPTVKHKSGSPLGARRETTPIKLSSVTRKCTHTHAQRHTPNRKQRLLKKSMNSEKVSTVKDMM